MQYIYGVHALKGRKWRRVVALSAALAALTVALRGQAFTATAGMPVRMEVIGSCIVAASDLDFGTYFAAGTMASLGQTDLQLRCPSGFAVEISLDAGTSGGRNRRQMIADSGRGTLDYDLYQDAGRTIPWGDRSGRDTLELTATGEPQSIPVYGEIPAGQRATEGSYSDTITVLVQF
jgi:spore coat protein U-like protein